MKLRTSTLIGCALALLSLPVASIWSGERKLTGTATAQDGDTLIMRGDYIRLSGIDAPEAGQFCTHANGTLWRCGRAATLELARLVRDKIVTCEATGTDRYERTVAICFVGDIDLGAEMVRAGLAVAYIRYSQRYVADEKTARLMKVGIWAGQFQTPEDWRRARGVGR